MPNKLSQKELALEYLKDNPDRFIPIYEFVGEKNINGQWYHFTFSYPKRLSELYNENKVIRQLIKGKSGVRYYSYKIK